MNLLKRIFFEWYNQQHVKISSAGYKLLSDKHKRSLIGDLISGNRCRTK